MAPIIGEDKAKSKSEVQPDPEGVMLPEMPLPIPEPRERNRRTVSVLGQIPVAPGFFPSMLASSQCLC